MTKKEKGFTLVELLVVMAIMSILTIISVSQFVSAKKKARDVSRKGDLNAVAKALQMYYADYNKMPAQSTETLASLQINNLLRNGGGDFADPGGYIYMKNMPKESGSGMPVFCYITDAANKKYALFSSLENDQDSEYNKYGAVDPITKKKADYGPFVAACGNGVYHYVNLSPNAAYDPVRGVK